MRWILAALVLWFAPVSFQSEGADEVSVQTERGGCPGGKCPPKRPRPRPTR